jgi:hypothetical protein
VEKPYHIVGKEESQELAKFLAQNGQALLPMVELIEQSKLALDELIDVLGRAQIEAVLTAVRARDRRATASGQERWGDRLAWRRGRQGLFERAKAASEATSAAQEGSG